MRNSLKFLIMRMRGCNEDLNTSLKGVLSALYCWLERGLKKSWMIWFKPRFWFPSFLTKFPASLWGKWRPNARQLIRHMNSIVALLVICWGLILFACILKLVWIICHALLLPVLIVSFLVFLYFIIKNIC